MASNTPKNLQGMSRQGSSRTQKIKGVSGKSPLNGAGRERDQRGQSDRSTGEKEVKNWATSFAHVKKRGRYRRRRGLINAETTWTPPKNRTEDLRTSLVAGRTLEENGEQWQRGSAARKVTSGKKGTKTLHM